MNRRIIEQALPMLIAAAALASIPLAGLAQETPTSAIRQMIELQLNSRATEAAPAGVPGLEAGQLVLPPPGRAMPAARLTGAASGSPLGATPAMPNAAARPLP